MILSLLMLVDYTVFQPAPAMGAIDKKSALVGGAVGVAAGAGIALAAPAIGSAVAGAGATGILGGIVGGVASIGGGVLGAISAFAGAIGGAISAVGGFIAGIFTSPLFIPALVVVGACVAGYFIYKKYKEKKAQSAADNEVLPDTEVITITPGDYEISSVIPQGNNDPIQTDGTEILKIEGNATSAVISDEVPTNVTTPSTVAVETTTVTPSNGTTLQAAQERYTRAYHKYLSLVNSGRTSGDEYERVFQEYRDANDELNTLKAIGAH